MVRDLPRHKQSHHQRYNNRWLFACLWLSFLWSYSYSSWSLPEDREQPIYMESDYAEKAVVKGRDVSTYIGDVIMIQGSMRLEGDKVIIDSDKRVVSMMRAYGEPAKFQQQQALDKSLVHAHADYIEYNVAEDTVLLVDNAYVEQAGSILYGDRVDYDILTDQVIASSHEEPTSRVRVILAPQDEGSSLTE